MVNQFYQKKKEEKLRKEARERCQNVSEVEKEKKNKNRLETDDEMFLKKKKSVSVIILNITRIFLKKKKES